MKIKQTCCCGASVELEYDQADECWGADRLVEFNKRHECCVPLHPDYHFNVQPNPLPPFRVDAVGPIVHPENQPHPEFPSVTYVRQETTTGKVE